MQDPNQAEYPDMPLAVLNNMEVDFVVSLPEIGEVINKLSQGEPGERVPIPEDVKRESQIAERVIISIDNVSEIGDQTIFTCPDCGGDRVATQDRGIPGLRVCEKCGSHWILDDVTPPGARAEDPEVFKIRRARYRRNPGAKPAYVFVG